MTETVWFDTGVLPGWGTPSTKPYGCQQVRRTIQIPIEVSDIPEGGIFVHAKDEILEYDRQPFMAYREILNRGTPGALHSRYAFFRVPTKGDRS